MRRIAALALAMASSWACSSAVLPALSDSGGTPGRGDTGVRAVRDADEARADAVELTDAGGSPSDALGSDDSGYGEPDALGPDARALDATPPEAGSHDGAILDARPVDASARDASGPDAAPADATRADATGADAARADTGQGTYRTSLGVCWTDATCARKLAIAHGGLWNATNAPYDSNAALEAAYQGDFDGVKIDVRVTRDNVPVIAHSSPIQLYESVNCFNRRIEDMTAAQVTACHRFPSTTENFQRLDDVLQYLRDKMVVQLTVKRQVDYARAIAEVIADSAQDYAFFEISTSDLQTRIPAISGSDQVYYLIEIANRYAEIDLLIDTIQNPRAFMYEMDPSPQVAMLVSARMHPAGVRAFTYDSSATAGVGELQALYMQGFDVVSAQTAANVQARRNVNQSQGVTPP